MSPTTTSLAEYLFSRLRQAGVGSIHGVPGDFNLELLDYVEPSGLKWVGNCNELNAGYAADGYARIKGLGAFITTFGVGELSAINAVAGAYAELAPVVHIVGTPSRAQQTSRTLTHHTLNDGEFGHFAAMYTNITVAQAKLFDIRTATDQIDAAIRQCLLQSRPVYISIPVDMVAVQVSTAPLGSPLKLPRALPLNVEEALAETLDRIKKCERPMILVDGESTPHGIASEVHQFVEETQWPTWTSAFGKGCIDESLKNVHGIWKGRWATEEERQYIESCDLIVTFGPHFSSTNTYLFTSIPSPEKSIMVKATEVCIGQKTFRDLPAKDFMVELLGRVNTSDLQRNTPKQFASSAPKHLGTLAEDESLQQTSLYPLLQDFLRPGDIILGETGTAGYGVREFRLPRGAKLFKPSTWLSIGYMLPGAQGAAIAQRELHAAGKWPQVEQKDVPRTILIIGDGSFQMTVQELSTIIREELNFLLILVNNDGYTIERCIHGKDQTYNDVARWRYLNAPAFFGAAEKSENGSYAATTAFVRTCGELKKVMKAGDVSKVSELRMLEVILEREDAQPPLSDLLEMQRPKNAKAGGA
jgi:pyruvate decarboxylase